MKLLMILLKKTAVSQQTQDCNRLMTIGKVNY